MAGKKRKAPANNAGSSRTTRSAAVRNDVPDIYRDMLVEADVRPTVTSPEKPIKKKRPGQRAEKPPHEVGPPPKKPKRRVEVEVEVDKEEDDEDDEDDKDIQFEDVSLLTATIQTMTKDSDEEDEEEDDDGDELGFEEVDFSFPNLNSDPAADAPKDLELNFSSRANATPRQVVERRKPINKAEKDRRVEIHKTHLLCLLSHVARRNRWCNDAVVQDRLRPILTKKTITYLNPGTHLTQFGRANSLKEGLQMVNAKFKTKFQITERGSRRALWAENEEHLQNYKLPDDAETPMEKSDFREAANSLQGSRDVGAQLYCALLRSAGVEARLVCSLQPLSFASGGPTMGKPPKARGRLSLEEQFARMPKYDSSFDSPALPSTLPARRRLGHPNATAFQVPTATTQSPSRQVPVTPKKIRESPFPVYWVEILDEAHQKWQPTDPLVTDSFWKPQKLEPPASDRENCMTYVVGFAEDGSAKDITRRYAKAYNAKTRRMRIESVASNGEKWWRKALRAYSHGVTTDLDQIEANELTAAESHEPMPRNIADFKDHPIYALERQLRRHEVLVPDASASGTIGAGSKGPLEKIYRRKDVRIARSREKWFRLGREVRADEVPVKVLTKRVNPNADLFGADNDELEAGGTIGTPIYTMEQTELYKAPPVINGRIPKNRFGNLDIYVPSMVPEGGVHITDDLGAQAAFTLGIDYAPALTGFEFRGRQGTAVLRGVIVAAENEEAVYALIAGIKDQEAELERERRTREVLRAWRRMLMNLRVRQRIWADVDSDDEAVDEEAMEVDKGKAVAPSVSSDGEPEDEPQLSDDSKEAGGGFVVDDEYAGGFMVD
ncbi:Uu.00g127190.m01.CDS01 [Anthostomella pinea]|uniref:Uu.00g127190.m01.CDS01 n=1 Tax=Anthostomella pinea TaxID=933095 RepID=A0AAI8YHR8_9PEZI|nr:Uu.00g127190.m01.CDS01 [Anthostomella pinea]